MDRRLSDLFTPSTVSGGFLYICLRDVVRSTFDKDYEEQYSDIASVLKFMIKNDIFRPIIVQLQNIRNDAIHNRKEVNFENLIGLLETIYEKTNSLTLGCLLNLFSCQKNVEYIEDGSYQRIEKFQGTFKEFKKEYYPHNLINREISINGEKFIFTRWMNESVKVCREDRYISIPFSTDFVVGGLYESECLEIKILYKIDTFKYSRVKSDVNEECHVTRNLKLLKLDKNLSINSSEIVKEYKVDGYDDGEYIYLKNTSMLSFQNSNLQEKIETKPTNTVTFAQTKYETGALNKDFLKGKTIRIWSGKHAGKLAIFKNWSGTTCFVYLIEENIKMGLNTGVLYELIE